LWTPLGKTTIKVRGLEDSGDTRSTHGKVNFEGEKGPAQDMSGGSYNQSGSVGGSTGTVRMPIGMY